MPGGVGEPTLYMNFQENPSQLGIPDAEKAAIFEPYYRGEGTAQLPGGGLGLATSQALVQQMGGRLEVESQVGVRSSFIVRFPHGAASDHPPSAVSGT